MEVCPEEIYGAQEIHVTGDVLVAFEQYYHTTQDQKLFREAGGWRLVCAVAQYWCSRMVWSEEEQCYHIRGVMPPDEHHCHVDNSAYTNAVAQRRPSSMTCRIVQLDFCSRSGSRLVDPSA